MSIEEMRLNKGLLKEIASRKKVEHQQLMSSQQDQF